MARIRKFKNGGAAKAVHPTEVDCVIRILTSDGAATLLQLDTYGSSEREMPNKLSQTIQLDKNRALELAAVINKHFG